LRQLSWARTLTTTRQNVADNFGPRSIEPVVHAQARGSRAWSLRLEAVVPFVPDDATDDTTILSMVSFVF